MPRCETRPNSCEFSYTDAKHANSKLAIQAPILLVVLPLSFFFAHLCTANVEIARGLRAISREEVLAESKEIADNYSGHKNKQEIASCKSRIEFWGDQDDGMDYFNEHLFILEQFMDNEKVLIYDFISGVFFDEN